MLKSKIELLFILLILIAKSIITPSDSNGQCVPYAKCISFLNISLDNNGIALVPAILLDNGSADTCTVPSGPVWFKVKRMFPPDSFDCYNPGNPDYMFDDVVQLCCADIGDSIQVILRVYNIDPGNGPVDDTVGTNHFNDCMLTLMAIDKIPPVIVCPPDTTIECGAMFNDYSLYGDPIVTDNCDSLILDVVIDTMLNICNVGTVTRKFIVTDAGGLKDSCTQTITVINSHPFDGNDPDQLIWPKDTFIYGCYDYIDTAISGRPIIIEDECDLVGVDYVDQSYYFGKRGACYKIIRIWKVLDWCQYDPKLGCSASNACWTHEQIIKILDTIAPVVTGVRDSTIYNYSADCSPIYVQLDTAISYDCDSSLIKRYSIKIDLYSDGSIDTMYSGNDASGKYPNGIHRITFLAYDKCGNIGDTTIILTVLDAKAPSPIGKPGIVVNLTQMQNGVMAMVFARQLDDKSYDNCTPRSKLRFSFSSDVNDTIRIYNCDSIINSSVKKVELWVTDEAGNQDYIKTFVFVQDNLGLCPGNLRNTIFGLVKNANGSPISFIDVKAKSPILDMNVKSNNDGIYEIRKIKSSSLVKVLPHTSKDPLEGVTTRDLVEIQKYLLGRAQFTSPWKILAADVDLSNHVSVRDIAILRNLILHKVDTFPKGQSWRFILSDFQFQDQSDPFSSGVPDSYLIQNYEGSKRVDFTGVKLGDVISSSTKVRTGQDQIQGVFIKEDKDWILSLDRDVDLTGLYLEIQLGDVVDAVHVIPSNLRGFNGVNYFFDKKSHILRISWVDGYGITIFEGQPLLKIGLESKVLSNNLDLEVFGKVMGQVILNSNLEKELDVAFIRGEKISGTIKRKLSKVSVTPNPFGNDVQIEWTLLNNDHVSIDIMDPLGRKVFTIEKECSIGVNTLTLTDISDWPAGIYLCTIRSSEEQMTVRMIKLNN